MCPAVEAWRSNPRTSREVLVLEHKLHKGRNLCFRRCFLQQCLTLNRGSVDVLLDE